MKTISIFFILISLCLLFSMTTITAVRYNAAQEIQQFDIEEIYVILNDKNHYKKTDGDFMDNSSIIGIIIAFLIIVFQSIFGYFPF